MANSIDNTEDTIDSRDVIERIEELESEVEDYENLDGDLELHDAHLDAKAELKTLKDLQSEAEGYSDDWIHGSQLIRESYFEQAMDEMVADCYEIPKNLPSFMTITLDYDALKQDYTEVDFDGVAYFIR